MRILKALKKMLGKQRTEWSQHPRDEGWYVVYKRGFGMDIIFWSGFEDDPCFEPQKNAHYFGPFRLPV